MNETLSYYNQHAKEFVESTVNVEFSEIQNRFTSYLNTGDYLLDFGCGSGRDSLAFIRKGFLVEAVDGSREICELASKLIGQPVRCMQFGELDEVNKYHGIWACSSILHLPKAELKEVFYKIYLALKVNGYLYTSFKYGEFEGIRNGRYFTDLTEDGISTLIEEIDGFDVCDIHITSDVRPGRGEEKWLNVIIKKWR